MFSLFSTVALGALLLFSSGLQPVQSRVEMRTESKIDARENAGKNSKPGKRTVWNLDGGVFFSTDGHLPNGSCFRLSGQVTAPDFFEGLRRVDTEEGTAYTLRGKVVTEYPEELLVTMHILDFPCTLDLKDTAVRPPLTRELLSTLRLSFFWKNGVAMRPVAGSKRTGASTRRLESYAGGSAPEEPAPRFEWNFSFIVASAGVPLSNDLVFVIEDADRKIAARTAARL